MYDVVYACESILRETTGDVTRKLHHLFASFKPFFGAKTEQFTCSHACVLLITCTNLSTCTVHDCTYIHTIMYVEP